MRSLAAALAFASSVATAQLAYAETRTNWYGDPFFALTHAVAACPEPLGPLVTEEEALRDSHHRAERGTRCWLEKRCRHPSSFDYDREIAARIEADVARIAPRPSSLWVLVQGRRVWVYGCVEPGYRRGSLARSLRKVPDVELAMEEVRVGPRGAVPYRLKE